MFFPLVVRARFGFCHEVARRAAAWVAELPGTSYSTGSPTASPNCTPTNDASTDTIDADRSIKYFDTTVTQPVAGNQKASHAPSQLAFLSTGS